MYNARIIPKQKHLRKTSVYHIITHNMQDAGIQNM